MFLLSLLCISGVVGCLGMTWLFPMLACLLWRRKRIAAMAPSAPIASVAVLIPAHNEEENISAGLETVRAAMSRARIARPDLAVKILVGADGCTDRTSQVAAQSGADVIESPECLGKWRMLNRLVESADAEWVILTDCGALWPADLLERSLELMREHGVIGVAPSYGNPDGGAIERVHWAIERHFKSLESRAGGPVSIHGATVMYRREELCKVLGRLAGRSWLNDDVVLPMLLRSAFPDKRIVYAPSLLVSDLVKPVRRAKPAGELVRRRRMVLGNVQWVREVLPALLRENPVAGLIALRRLFRIFWAYWLGMLLVSALAMCIGAPSVISLLGSILTVVLCALLFYLVVSPLRRILESAYASLMAPYYCFVSVFRLEGAVWK